VLDVLYQQIPPDRQGTSEVLVDFASQDLVNAMSQHLFLASQVRDKLAAPGPAGIPWATISLWPHITRNVYSRYM